MTVLTALGAAILLPRVATAAGPTGGHTGHTGASQKVLASAPSAPHPQAAVVDQTTLLASLERSGVAETMQRRIYFEACEAADRATAEANKAVPLRAGDGVMVYQRQVSVQNRLDEAYRRDLLQRYRSIGLTGAELCAIRARGVQKNWPLPAPPDFD